MIRLALALLFTLATIGAALAQEPYFEVDALNTGLPALAQPIDRSTPQSSMEAFLDATEIGDDRRAAHVLDLSDVAPQVQEERGAELARKLAVILDRKVVIDWRDLLERPDALDANAASENVMGGKPRRSLLIGVLDLDDRAVAVRLNRLKPKDDDPVWVFSRQSIHNVDALHALYGPSQFERALPDGLRRDAFWGLKVWEIIGLPFLLAATTVLAKWLWRVLGAPARHWSNGLKGKALRAMRLPATLALVTFVVQMATTSVFVFSGVISSIIQPLILLGYIAAILSLIVNVIDIALDTIIETDFEDMSAADAEEKRSIATTVAAVRRLIIVAAVLLAGGMVLTSSNTFQAMGFSLLASAGALTLLLAFAARNVLGNIMSSMQIALNRSARIGDQLVFQGDLCQVEKIQFTFVQLRHWTGSRMIVPVETFVSEVFYNRSIVSQEMIRTVTLTLAQTVDFESLRADFMRIAEDEKDACSADNAAMRVIDQDAFGATIRFEFLCPDPATAWDAECRVREALLLAVRARDAEAFPDGAARMQKA